MEEVEVDLEQAFWPKAAHLSSISGAYHHFSSTFGLVENLQQVFSLRPAQLICTAWPKCITQMHHILLQLLRPLQIYF